MEDWTKVCLGAGRTLGPFPSFHAANSHPSTAPLKDDSTFCRRQNCLFSERQLTLLWRCSTKSIVNICAPNIETSGPLLHGSQKAGTSPHKQEIGKFLPGESDQPKRKDLKLLTSEVLPTKELIHIIPTVKLTVDKSLPCTPSFFYQFFSFSLKYKQTTGISKHLSILHRVSFKRSGENKEAERDLRN